MGLAGGLSTNGQLGPSPTGNWQATDQGVLAWAFDSVNATGSSALTPAGTMFVTRIHCPVAISVTNVIISVTGAGVTLTSGQCFACLYQSGNLVGVSADQSAAWTSTGLKTTALASGPFAVKAGEVFVGFWFNGTTGPQLARGTNNTGQANLSLSGSNSRFGSANAGLTTTAPGTLGAVSAQSLAYWAALS